MIKVVKASTVTLLCIFIVSFIIGFNTNIAHSPADWDGALLISSIATIVGFVSLICWGIPVHLVLHHKKLSSIFWYTVSGVFPGVIIVFVFNFFGKDSFFVQIQQSLTLGIFGAFAASIFDYIVNRNDD